MRPFQKKEKPLGNVITQLFNLALISFILTLSGCSTSRTATVRNSDGVVFETAEDALHQFKSAFASEDPKELISIFGTIGTKIFITGDPIADAHFMRSMSQKLQQRAELLDVVSTDYQNERQFKVRFGTEGWNLRVPIVNRGQGWLFATEYAKGALEEMRREINEVRTSDTLILLGAAQRKYMESDRDGDGVREYAQKIMSSPGKADGLYWTSSPELGESPITQNVAKAIEAGYDPSKSGGPYFGYRYRILQAQAVGPRGIVESYMKGSNLVRGFAILAYPVNWSVSGNKTFLITSNGVAYKKDLGFKTASIAESMKAARIDNTWAKVEHPELGLRLE
jgi:Protein of unknown function (DUF2950)